MSKKDSPAKSLFRIIRAIVFGVGLYLFLTNLPMIILRMNGINLSQPQEQLEDEPVYHDSDGKRISVHEYNEMVAYEKAEKDNITSHAECKELYPESNQGFSRNGCHRYVTEQKNFPEHIKQGGWDSGKSTAECEAEVRAYWEPLLQDMVEKGEEHAANSWSRRNFGPELDECRNYDNIRIGKFVYEPLSRLNALIAKLEQGGEITAADNATIFEDRQLVASYPENQYTREYANKLDVYFRLAAKNSK